MINRIIVFALPSIHAMSYFYGKYFVFTVFTFYLFIVAATAPTPYSICELFGIVHVFLYIVIHTVCHTNDVQCVCHVLLSLL